MNKTQADLIIAAITDILTNRDLVSVARIPGDRLPDIRVHQTFDKAYRVDYTDGGCCVGISDSYGVMTGSTKWTIDPDRRAIHAETTNGFGEYLSFSWVITDDYGELWEKMNEWRNQIWKSNRPLDTRGGGPYIGGDVKIDQTIIYGDGNVHT